MNLLSKYFSMKHAIAESIEHPMIEHNGVMVHKNNSEGKPIHGTDEGIKNFHNWFEDSKMTDKHGRPQTYYHGTSENFSHFSKETSNKNTKTGVPENTHFFSNDPEAASSYAKQKSDMTNHKSWGEGGNVKPVYIKAKKVLKIDAKGDPWNNISYKTKEGRGDYDINDLSHIAKGGKYHAMVVKNVHDRQEGKGNKPATSVAVFTHNQVKSIYNNGKWDKNSDHISESIEHPMIEHNGVMVHKNNSEGMPIHSTDEGIKNFHNWSGGHELKDAHGRPKVVYHGTDKDFSSVDPKKGAQGTFWFASHKENITSGDSGAAHAKVIKPLYVKMKHPAGWDAYDKLGLHEFTREGHEGAVLPNESEHQYSGFVFKGENVKAADKNSGKFSNTNKLKD